MKAFILLALTLASCGLRTQLEVAAVAPSVSGIYERLREELRAEAGYDVLVPSSTGIWIVTDNVRVDARSRETGRDSGGFWNPAYNEVVLPRPDLPISYNGGADSFLASEDYFAVIVAHELAHAMGFPGHTESGLMSPAVAPECIGRAALCLLDTLGIPRLPATP